MINDAINIREATRQDTDQIVQFQQSMAQEGEGVRF